MLVATQTLENPNKVKVTNRETCKTQAQTTTKDLAEFHCALNRVTQMDPECNLQKIPVPDLVAGHQ